MACYLCGSRLGSTYTPCPECLAEYRKQTKRESSLGRLVDRTSLALRSNAWRVTLAAGLFASCIALFLILNRESFLGPPPTKEQLLFQRCTELAGSYKEIPLDHPLEDGGPWDATLQYRFGMTPGRARLVALQNGDAEPCAEIYGDCVDFESKSWCRDLLGVP